MQRVDSFCSDILKVLRGFADMSITSTMNET